MYLRCKIYCKQFKKSRSVKNNTSKFVKWLSLLLISTKKSIFETIEKTDLTNSQN